MGKYANDLCSSVARNCVSCSILGLYFWSHTDLCWVNSFYLLLICAAAHGDCVMCGEFFRTNPELSNYPLSNTGQLGTSKYMFSAVAHSKDDHRGHTSLSRVA